MPEGLLVVALVVTLLVPAGALWLTLRGRRAFATATERAAYGVLHTANLAAPPFRDGLTPESAAKGITHLRELLGTPAVALTDDARVLAWEGPGDHHAQALPALIAPVLEDGRARALAPATVACERPGCLLQAAVVAPLLVEGVCVGTLAAFVEDATPGLVLLTREVATWVATQVELAELDTSRARLAEADLRLLRAQISPHFVYNALSAIASFTHDEPDRARELLTDFADFTRHSFRSRGEFTTLAEELRAIEQYLRLEHARFGDRLEVSLRVVPDVLGVTVPVLVLQPLVENAVRHGLEGARGRVTVSIAAADAGPDALVEVEDDGPGMDPDWLREHLAGRDDGTAGVGLTNVDERLRTLYGPEFGLAVETAVGAGTKITVRLPKFPSSTRVA